MLEAMARDLGTYLRDQERNVSRLDTSIGAGRELLSSEAENQAWRDESSNSHRAQNLSESRVYWFRYELQLLASADLKSP